MQFSENDMQNGQDSMQQMAAARAPSSQHPGEGGAIGISPDSGQALVAAIQRIRVIEGERQVNRILHALAGESDQVMVAHGAQPPAPRSAELESLHSQLKRAQAANENGRTAHQALQKSANELAQSMAEIATMGDSISAQKLREMAMEAVKTWETATS
jgi:hypothetical protein